MMNILFLSQNSPGFSTLRSNHIREFLHHSEKYTTHEVLLTDQNIYEEQLHANLYSLSTFCDAIITAGPFLPALALPYLNSKTPIWMESFGGCVQANGQIRRVAGTHAISCGGIAARCCRPQ